MKIFPRNSRHPSSSPRVGSWRSSERKVLVARGNKSSLAFPEKSDWCFFCRLWFYLWAWSGWRTLNRGLCDFVRKARFTNEQARFRLFCLYEEHSPCQIHSPAALRWLSVLVRVPKRKLVQFFYRRTFLFLHARFSVEICGLRNLKKWGMWALYIVQV